MQNLKNIIFDLGAVILNLDMLRTDKAFEQLVGNTELYWHIKEELHKEQIFNRFEVGDISADDFIDALKSRCPLPVTAAQVRKAWSAMLLDMPKVRIDFLQQLQAAGYKLYLLSNINSIHLEDVYAIIRQAHGDLDFDALFEKPYYSHLIGRRKPDVSTFDFVLNDAGLRAEETLFIDDNADNVEGAQTLGLHSIHHQANSDLAQALQFLL